MKSKDLITGLGVIALLLFCGFFTTTIQAVETKDEKASAYRYLKQAVDKAAAEKNADMEMAVPQSVSMEETQAQDMEEVPDQVQTGDLVSIQLTATQGNGVVFFTTEEQVDKDTNRKKADWYMIPDSFLPYDTVAGMEDTAFPGLADSIPGMKVGEKKTLTLPTEKTYGAPNPKQIAEYPVQKTMPKVKTMGPAEFVERYGVFPVVNDEVTVNPYFNARITTITKQEAVLEVVIPEEKRFEETFGVTEIETSNDDITLRLQPKIGSLFNAGQAKGRVVSVNDEVFKVDFNNPLAGQDIEYEVEVVLLTKASQFVDWEMPWFDDYDMALAEAKEDTKPAVLVLYADWCGYSKRFFDETINDQRVKNMTDKFVWVKIDSSIHEEYKEKYGQNGYPMIVLLNTDGEVYEKIDGFRDGQTFYHELNRFLQHVKSTQAS